MIDLKKLETKIVDVFQNQKGLQFAKNVTKFNDLQGDFIADHINFLIIEENDDDAPLIISIVTPFDEVSKKAPQQAIIFHNGVVQLSIDFTEYADIRTGIMDAIVLRRAYKNLGNKKILLVGSGKTARWSILCMAALAPEVNVISYTNTSVSDIKLESEVADKIQLNYMQNPDPKDFDVVICHTSSKKPIFTIDDLKQMKPGSFLSYYNKTEIPEQFLVDASQVIYDWRGNVKDGKDKYYLNDLIGGRSVDDSGVTVFKSSGTPLQNYAVLKTIYNEKN